MICPDCGAKTKVGNSRTIDKPGRSIDVVQEIAPLVSTRFFVWRERSCSTCGWRGESVELTRQHLEYLLARASLLEEPEILELQVRVVRKAGKHLKATLVGPTELPLHRRLVDKT